MEHLTGSEIDALEYLYGGGDEVIECRSIAWVVTRCKQKCVSILHSGAMPLPVGTRMVLERAKVEGKFGSCYTCESCITKSENELRGRSRMLNELREQP
jgi:hypothetical protein